MDAPASAQIGDEVVVQFPSGRAVQGTVKSLPQATGDCWIIVNAMGTIFHVQIFESIVVRGRRMPAGGQLVDFPPTDVPPPPDALPVDAPPVRVPEALDAQGFMVYGRPTIDLANWCGWWPEHLNCCIPEAMRMTADKGCKSPMYTQSILKRWHIEGTWPCQQSPGPAGASSQPRALDPERRL